MYVFHDPAQAIYRDDSVAGLGMTEYPLDLNCRNAQPIHDVVRRFAGEGLASGALREDGRAPEFIEAAIGEPTTGPARRPASAPRRRRRQAGDIAVLTGARLDESVVWAVPGHRFGNQVLGNAAVDDAGHNLGLAAHLVPELPADVILCETIRRFKGLERPVIVLVELPEEDARSSIDCSTWARHGRASTWCDRLPGRAGTSAMSPVIDPHMCGRPSRPGTDSPSSSSSHQIPRPPSMILKSACWSALALSSHGYQDRGTLTSRPSVNATWSRSASTETVDASGRASGVVGDPTSAPHASATRRRDAERLGIQYSIGSPLLCRAHRSVEGPPRSNPRSRWLTASRARAFAGNGHPRPLR